MKTKEITVAAILIALSVILSFVKIQGSVAFDLLPSIVGGILFLKNNKRIKAALITGTIALLGNLATSLTSGFPYGADIHVVVAICMFAVGFCFAMIYAEKNILRIILSVVVAILLNLASLPYVAHVISPVVAGSLVGPILIGASISIIVGIIVGQRMNKVYTNLV